MNMDDISGIDFALSVFHEAAKDVIAYKTLLRHHNIDPTEIVDKKGFEKLPVIDKHNYLLLHSFEEVVNNSKLPPIMYSSTGSSGKPTFWFRGDEQVKAGAVIHERIIRDIFKIKKDEPTLVVNCFGMGVWIAGLFTADVFNKIANDGYKITTVSPGIIEEDALLVLKEVAPFFSRVVMVGYPPLIMKLLIAAQDSGVLFPEKKFKLILSGDRFTEIWRNTALEIIGAYNDTDSVINLYGSADTAVSGYETPTSIFIRRQALENKQLSKKILGDYKLYEPAILQYDPQHIYLESINDELVVTANTAAPLIRYNIHDSGHVFSAKEMSKILREHDLESEAKKAGFSTASMPFVVLKGRTDIDLTLNAANIYPQDIQYAINDKTIKEWATGSYFAYSQFNEKHTEESFIIEVVVKPEVNVSKLSAEKISKIIAHRISQSNSEYRKIQADVGENSNPIVKFVSESTVGENPGHGHKKGIISKSGKKPKKVSV